MSISGTDAYAGLIDLPDLVVEAVDLARRLGFPSSCRPEQGRLLHALVAGALEGIGETGTGCGVGLAWMITARRPGVRIVSVERDEQRAAETAKLFADIPDVEILYGDWTRIYERGPYDLLVVDGGGNGKKTSTADPESLLRAAGRIIIDDFTPMTQWPPQVSGQPDTARLGWLEHPALLCTEVQLAEDLATIIGTRRP